MTPTEKRLLSLIKSGRLPRGMLFSGPESEALSLAALFLAQKLFCPERESPCRTCGSCIRAAEGHHPDFLRIVPEKQEISIEVVRELSTWVARAPFEAPVKLAVINGAQSLSLSASNSLLKVLEEPPPHAHIILATLSPDSLLKTILSRLFHIRFPLNPSITLADFHPDAPWRKTLSDLVQGIIPPRVETLFSLTEEVTKDEEELRAFFHQMESTLLHEMQGAQEAQHSARVKHLDSVFSAVQRAERDLLQRYGNCGLTIDSILLRWLS